MTNATKARTGTLDDIAADSHVFSIIAMDQRNTLRRMFTAVGLDASDDDLRIAKADVARVLTPAATGLLSDPTYGVPAITEAKALAPNCGLLIAAEPSERRSYQGEPRTHRAPDLATRAAMPSSSSSSCAPTALPRPPVSRTWSPRRWPSVRKSSAIAAPRVSLWSSRTSCTCGRGKTFAARPAKTRSSRRPWPSTTWTSTCSSSNIPVHRKAAGGLPRSSTGLGPSCPLAFPSTNSLTSSGSQPTRGEPPASSPAAQCGAKSSASSVISARSSSHM